MTTLNEKLLHASIQCEPEDILECLSQGADVNYVSKDNCNTPLMHAAEHGDIECLQILIDHQADVNQRQQAIGWTALFSSIGDQDCMKLLLQHGADTNIQDFQGDSVLHYAVKFGLQGIATLLVNHGINMNLKNHNGETALDILKNDNKYPDIIALVGAETERQSLCQLIQADANNHEPGSLKL